MILGSRKLGAGLLLVLPVLLLLLIGSTGLYSVDEAVYLAGIDAMATHGGLIIENGYETYGSSNQTIFFLIEGPSGLVTQYPSGYSILTAPFYALLGIRGILLVNSAAALLAIWATKSLAFELFGDRVLARNAALILVFGTFFLEFSAAVWPHMQTILLTSLALLAAVKAEAATGRRAFGLAVLSGLAIGLGVNVRADMILILPVIGAHILLTHGRPISLIAGGALGLLPGLVLAGLLNLEKFGTFNPISYGTSGGGVDPRSHASVIVFVAVALLLMMVRKPILARVNARVVGAVLVIGAVLAMIFVPEAQRFAIRYLNGVHRLVIDLTALPMSAGTREGVIYLPDGTISFWGFWKKALVQSLPWLAAVPALLLFRWDAQNSRGLALIVLAVLLFPLPYIYLSWHGGLGSNMRYLLPLLPLLAIAGAWAWMRLRGPEDGSAREIVIGLFVAVMGVAATIASGAGFGALHQILPVYAAAVVFLSALAARFTLINHRLTAALARTTFVAGLALATILGPALDVTSSQLRRTAIQAAGEALAAQPGPSVIYGMGEVAIANMGSEGGIYASPSFSGFVDIEFLESAGRDGYRIYVPHLLAPNLVREGSALSIKGDPIEAGAIPYVEIQVTGMRTN